MLMNQMNVTISIGAAMSRTEDTAESILSRADRLMYLSKSCGRNRVMEDEDHG